jgi:hypothetical protein
MAEIIEHVVGDTSDIKLLRPQLPDLPAVLDGNWVCKQRVLNPDGTELIAEQTITDKYTDSDSQEWFIAAVKPADSATMAVTGDYVDYQWFIQIENATTTPSYKRELMATLRTRKQGVTS